MAKYKSRLFILFSIAFVIGTIALFLKLIDGWMWVAIPGAFGIINETRKRIPRTGGNIDDQ